jgi:dihydropteroate synthase
MQRDVRYRDVVTEVERFLFGRAEAALAAGVSGVIVDPGIGFGKRLEHNLVLIRELGRLASGPYPVMLGASRKGFLGHLSGEERVAERDPASLAAHLFAARQGAALLRVHDVAAHRQALAVWEALGG